MHRPRAVAVIRAGAGHLGRALLARLGYRVSRILVSEHAVCDGVLVQFDHAGERFRFLLSNPWDTVQKPLYLGRPYEAEEIALICRYMPPGATLVDVGANIGNHAVMLARLCNLPQIVAFEPNPVAARLLDANLVLNGLEMHAKVHRLALSDRTGTARLIPGAAHNLGGARIGADGGGGEIPLARGDDLLASTAVGFVKMDVEGHELAALAGLRATLMRDRPPVFVEVQDANADAFASFRNAIGYRTVETHRRYPGETNHLILPADF